MVIAVGDHLPDCEFAVMTENGPGSVKTNDVFSGKKVVLFAVPGAFTPTCHNNHLPGFLEHAASFKTKGVDEIVCTSVNDIFVLSAWAKATGAEGNITFLSDGNGAFAKALGLDFDGSPKHLGHRSKRYAMLVEDGVVKTLNVEDAPGQAEKSAAKVLFEAM